MLVEDDKSLREIYGIRLVAEGYDIKSAGDGEEALAMIIKERPDLVISDVMMPKISGFDMLDILRATPETKDVKVIMMTALSSEDQRSRGESLGANKYLVKSQVGIEDVIRSVHEVLGDAPVVAPAAPSFGPMVSTTPSSTPKVIDGVKAQPQATTPAPSAPVPVTTPAPQAISTPEPVMPQPTAPFSSPAPASLADNMVKPTQPNIQTVSPSSVPAPAPNPAPTVVGTPASSNISLDTTSTPVAPVAAAPIQDVIQPQPQVTTPAPSAPQDNSLNNIADMIAKELGSSQTPQNPNQPQA